MKVNKEINELLNMQDYMDRRDNLQRKLVDSMKDKYPTLEEISVSDTSLSVKTQKYSLYVSTWTDDVKMYSEPEPTMACDGKMDLPDTVDEFRKLKENMDNDRNACIEVFKELFPIFVPKAYSKLKKRYEENKEHYEDA